MPHELFAIHSKPRLDKHEADRIAYLREKLSLAQDLGLEAQVGSIKADIAAVERGSLITTPPMTETELAIWREWLPIPYTGSLLENYRFDRIPQPVLKFWQKHKESGAFERFEIWTPKHRMPDPILVGVNGNARHLLARWGESDVNLMSFDDIKRELMRQSYYRDMGLKEIASTFLSVLVALSVMVIFLLDFVRARNFSPLVTLMTVSVLGSQLRSARISAYVVGSADAIRVSSCRPSSRTTR